MSVNSAFVGIPSKLIWIQYSTPTTFRFIKHKRTNRLLLTIDKLLDDYDQAFTKTDNLVLAIAITCCEWLIHKESPKKAHRWPAVQRLLENLKQELTRRVDNADFTVPRSPDVLKRYLLRIHHLLLQELKDVNRLLLPSIRGAGLVVLKQKAIECCDWLISRERYSKTLKEEVVEGNLASLLHGLFELDTSLDFTIRRTPVQLKVYLLQINVLASIARMGRRTTLPSQRPNLTPLGRKIFRALEQRLGDYGRGKTLDRAYWTETIPIVDPSEKTAHLYGGGVGRKQLVKLRASFFSPLTSKQKLQALQAIPYRVRAAELFRRAQENPSIIVFGDKDYGNVSRIWYFDDEDRALHQLHRKGEKFGKIDAEETFDPYHTGESRKSNPYAMDTEGHLFSFDAGPRERDGVRWQIQHSSMLAGQAALCAGMIYVKFGQLYAIDNNSGHYRPSTLDLLKCLRELKNKFHMNLEKLLTADASQDLKHPTGELCLFRADVFVAAFGKVRKEDRMVVDDRGKRGKVLDEAKMVLIYFPTEPEKAVPASSVPAAAFPTRIDS